MSSQYLKESYKLIDDLNDELKKSLSEMLRNQEFLAPKGK